jgi:hypothetical protein
MRPSRVLWSIDGREAVASVTGAETDYSARLTVSDQDFTTGDHVIKITFLDRAANVGVFGEVRSGLDELMPHGVARQWCSSWLRIPSGRASKPVAASEGTRRQFTPGRDGVAIARKSGCRTGGNDRRASREAA